MDMQVHNGALPCLHLYVELEFVEALREEISLHVELKCLEVPAHPRELLERRRDGEDKLPPLLLHAHLKFVNILVRCHGEGLEARCDGLHVT